MRLLALIVLLISSLAQNTRITLANARAVEVGMTRAEVEGVLGPERDETGGRVLALCPPEISTARRTTDDRQWVSRRAVINVCFDRKTGRVAEVWPYEATIWNPTLWDRVEA